MSPQVRRAVEGEAKEPLIYRDMLLLFIVLVCCFTAWGVAADLTTPMVAGFKRIFEMSTFQASLVQLAVLRGLLPAGAAGGVHQRAIRLQGRHTDRVRAWLR